jgi:hypothetical protein
MSDLDLLAARFLTAELPKQKEYLRRYFKGDIQERLIVYYLTFPPERGYFPRFYQNFIAHTGIYCSERWVQLLIKRVRQIEDRLARAERDGDPVMVAEIKSGTWRPAKT